MFHSKRVKIDDNLLRDFADGKLDSLLTTTVATAIEQSPPMLTRATDAPGRTFKIAVANIQIVSFLNAVSHSRLAHRLGDSLNSEQLEFS